MRAHNDFIVHIPQKYKDSIETKKGTKIYVDSRFSSKDAAENIFEVVNIPVNYNGSIRKGSLLLVDPILVHNQRFEKWGTEQNQYLVDREKKLYKVPPSLVICYAPKNGSNFKGFNDNLICQKREIEKTNKERKIGSIIIPDMSVENNKDTSVLQVVISNEKLKQEENVFKDDLIYYKPFGAIDIMINSKKYIWLKNNYVLAKYLKSAS